MLDKICLLKRDFDQKAFNINNMLAIFVKWQKILKS